MPYTDITPNNLIINVLTSDQYNDIENPSDQELYLITDDDIGTSDVQINGTSILSEGVANIVTNTAYDASSNKIATMSDIPSTITKSASDNTDGYVLFAPNTQSGNLSSVNTKRVSLTYNSSNHTDTFKISGGETYNGDSFLGQLGLGYGTNTTYLKSGYISSNVTLTLPSSTGTLALTSQIPTVPTNVSSFTNDAGYLTSYTETDPTVPEWAKADNKPTYTYSEVGAAASNHSHTQIYSGSGSTIGRVSTSASSVTMTATGESPSGSSYTNSLTLTPSQTAIYNLRTPTGDKDAATKKYVDDKDTIKTTAGAETTEYNLIGTATSNANTAAVSIYNPTLLSFAKYTNNYARLTVGDTATPGVVRLYSSASSASGFTDLKSNASSTNERTITFPDATGTVALTSDIPSISSWALASSKPSYTFSELTSHPTTISGYGITDAYTKTEVDGLVSGVLHYKGTKATVSALPSSGNAIGDVWHITADGSEYAWDGSNWQELGTTVDLSGYVPTSTTVNGKTLTGNISLTASDVSALPSNTTYVSTFNGQSGAITYTAPVTSVNGQTGAVTITIPTDVSDLNNDAGYLTSYTETDPTVPSWAKASSKPSYTANEVGAAASTHAHGNITSGGDITTNATIASGDRLIINDESASKVTNSSITFGSSTTQYLANNGTWQNVPSAYDDTALAARVTALEQIPWVTYYTGQNAPSNSQGSNGDLYLQTSSS